MAQVKEQSGLSNPFARNNPSLPKKPQQPVQKVDTARENVKKQLLEAFENSSDQQSDQATKFTNDQLVADIENLIFDLTGKNSKDKSYREKAKKILSRVKGNRNVGVRMVLKNGVITASDFCKLSDKQIDDDSYFDKFGNNGNGNSNDAKPRVGTKPPNFKSIPINAIDISNSADSVNEYFNSIHTKENEDTPKDKPLEELATNQLVIGNSLGNNVQDCTGIQSNIETNGVRTDTFSVREEPKEVPAETGRLSPRASNGRAIQFNPPVRNTIQTHQNKNMVNQTYEIGGNQNSNTYHESVNHSLLQNTTSDEIHQSSNASHTQKKADKLQELRRLMEEKKGKNLSMVGKVIQKNQVESNCDVIKSEPEISVVQISSKDMVESCPKIFDSNAEVSVNEKNTVEAYSEDPHKSVKHDVEVIAKDKEQLEQSITQKNPFDDEDKLIIPKINSVPFKPPQNIFNNQLLKPSSPPLIQPNAPVKIFENDLTQHTVKNPTIENESNQLTQINIEEQKQNILIESEVDLEKKEKKLIEETRHNPSLSNLKGLSINREQEENSFKILNSYTNSPKLDSRSNYTYSNRKNINNISKDNSIYSMKDKMRNFQETKVTLETGLDLANKKCEVYEKEIVTLRRTINELKLKLSRTNEEAYKLEISRLKQSVSTRDKENQILTKENQSLKQQVNKHQANLEDMLEENKRFRLEAERRFTQYIKELEAKQIVTTNYSYFKEKESDKKDEINPINFRKELQVIHNKQHLNSNVSENSIQNISINKNETHNQVNEEINNLHHNNFNHYDDDYDQNNFTNGNPNTIEEVGAHNYLNMNGNTYDEMKDLKQDEDLEILQDHQCYENDHYESAKVNNKYEILNDFPQMNKPNSGDTFNKKDFFLNAPSEEEYGSNKNLFNNEEEERKQEEDIFNTYTKSKKEKDIKSSPKQKETNKIMSASSTPVNVTLAQSSNVSRRNIFEENAFDIFDKSDNAKNIFDSFSNLNNARRRENEGLNSNIFDSQI